ncbi:hypothetical protein [Stratiformator vulcanicus]|uniref:Uncharacterized protein n=1 Tax=Stratiformator vulcanicus TaxID=2527980 RepID=A0A517R664_9PLAN|nr:hypothetical protein [Stratiformator vulcanicus]QDT39335.1 hypothetical protein Pan189_37410 [Stratiformator vulcanicus]
MTYGHLLYAIHFPLLDIRNDAGAPQRCGNIADAVHNLPEGIYRGIERGISTDDILDEIKDWQSEKQNTVLHGYLERATQVF